MTKYLLDTNIILRFLLGDHKDHSPLAEGLFREAMEGKCVLILTDVAIAEAVWVLMSFYKVNRSNTAEKLSKIIGSVGIKCPNQNQMLDALDRFKTTSCDFFDCYLAAMASDSEYHVASFNQSFKKFKDVTLWDKKSAQKKN